MSAAILTASDDLATGSGGDDHVRFRVGQGVEIATGGSGRVVGFYRSGTPTVLVALERGGTREFLPQQLLAPSRTSRSEPLRLVGGSSGLAA
jgi:hypothetical protein